MAAAAGASISLSMIRRRLRVEVLTLMDPCELGWGLATFPYATGIPPSCERRTTAVPGGVLNSIRVIGEIRTAFSKIRMLAYISNAAYRRRPGSRGNFSHS